MPATLGDHRGIIKAAVIVVNRAANKGSRGKKGKRMQGRGGSMVSVNGNCPFFVPSFVWFAHCDLPIWRYIKI